MMTQDDLKRLAARRALDYVQDDMVIGLGSGSTTAHFVELLAARLRAGDLRNVVGVPTSERTASQARALGIPLTTLDAASRLHLAVDGADEIDPALNLIKGLGRALLREKIVEVHAERFIVIVDESKLSPRLGVHCPLPVEIAHFGANATLRWLQALGCRVELWQEHDGSPVATDNGHPLVSCWFPDGIADPYRLARVLSDRPGVIEHGLFLDMADIVLVASDDGVHVWERQA